MCKSWRSAQTQCSRRPAPPMSPPRTLCGFIKHSERLADKVQGCSRGSVDFSYPRFL